MLLSDVTIAEYIADEIIKIEPYDPIDLQPSSIDLHLDGAFRVFKASVAIHERAIDVRRPPEWLTDLVRPLEDRPFIMAPGQFVLASTVERIELPNDLVGRIEGKSSNGRIGLMIHSTAGYVDPGWRGQLTLELSNLNSIPLALYPGMRIAQLSFHQLTTPVSRPYGSTGLRSRYQDQSGPTASLPDAGDQRP